MLFKRRKKLYILQKIRNFLLPAKGIVRGFKYIWVRTWRIKATPHAIAIGCAVGAFASFTPFLGFHFFIAMALAYVFRGNLFASIIGTAVGNPFTFPFIWYANLKVGNFILGRAEIPKGDFNLWQRLHHEGWSEVWVIVKPMAIGGIPIGILTAVIVYFLVNRSVAIFQRSRRKKKTINIEATHK